MYIVPVIITILVSAVSSAILWYLFDLHYIKGLVGMTALQIIISMVYNAVKSVYLNKVDREQETLRIKEFSKQGIDAPCAYCGVNNYIPIRLDRDNNFNCTACGKPNAVYISMTTAQKTQAISDTRLNIHSVLEAATNE